MAFRVRAYISDGQHTFPFDDIGPAWDEDDQSKQEAVAFMDRLAQENPTVTFELMPEEG